ncbi:MAG: anti-sigma factor [Rhizobium sp.]|uniref:anti-sigma factor family protein n=1 Tax=Rhizobium sp. TaxID=391 RepID=UPI000645E0A2
MTAANQTHRPEWPAMLHGFIDGELDSAHAAQVEAHLATCSDCAGEVQRLRAVRHAIGRDGVRWQAPEAFRARILAMVGRESAAAMPQPPEQARRHLLGFIQRWSLLPSLAALAASAFLFVNMPPQDLSIQDQLLASHVRSLLADHLTDVETSDQHTVKPWFNGKLDFSPPVVDLAAEGFALAGGRVDYIGGRVVAALIYRRHGHVINVFVWPGPPAARTTALRDGYNIEEWSAGGLQFSAVSDVNATDLTAFRDSFTRAAGI